MAKNIKRTTLSDISKMSTEERAKYKQQLLEHVGKHGTDIWQKVGSAAKSLISGVAASIGLTVVAPTIFVARKGRKIKKDLFKDGHGIKDTINAIFSDNPPKGDNILNSNFDPEKHADDLIDSLENKHIPRIKTYGLIILATGIVTAIADFVRRNRKSHRENDQYSHTKLEYIEQLERATETPLEERISDILEKREKTNAKGIVNERKGTKTATERAEQQKKNTQETASTVSV